MLLTLERHAVADFQTSGDGCNIPPPPKPMAVYTGSRLVAAALLEAYA